MKKITIILLVLTVPCIWGHHFKGLPHFSYFENYPQIPQEEFLGQNGDYEYSLVLYDFQGLKQMDMDQPNDARLFLIIFNMRKNKVYKGKVRLTICDNGKPIVSAEKKSQEENIYAINQTLTPTGKYSLKVTLLEGKKITTEIPFILSSQKISWGKWISLSLFVLIVIAGIGSRRARVIKDRKMQMKKVKDS